MRGHKCYGTPIDLNSTGPQFNRSSALVSCLMYEGEGLGRHHHEHLLEGKWLWKWSWLLWTSLGRKHHSNSVQDFFHVIYLDWWSLVGEGGSPRPLTRVHYIVKGSCCSISTPGHKPPAPHQDLQFRKALCTRDETMKFDTMFLHIYLFRLNELVPPLPTGFLRKHWSHLRK